MGALYAKETVRLERVEEELNEKINELESKLI